MKKKQLLSKALGMLLAMTMCITTCVPVLASDIAAGTTDSAVTDSSIEAVVSADEELVEETETIEEVISRVKEGENSSQTNIEINQGMSIHAPVKGREQTYMNDFVAKKTTTVMFKIPGSDDKDEAAAKEIIKNYTLECKAVNNGTEAENNELSANSENYTLKQAYVEDGDQAAGWYAVVNFPTGPDKGTYNFRLKDGDTEVALNKGVNFYETNPMNILIAPVNAYWSAPQDGSAPESGAPSAGSFKASELQYTGLDESQKDWSNLKDELKTYLLDVYPLADINIEEGKEIDASDESYDMVKEDGQKKLWEEACKLQAKDKESGKDKYDIILAFVAYRQGTGGGQGYTFGKPANIITYRDVDMFPTVAHEIAHCYQVGDEYDGGSFNMDVNQAPNGYKGRNFVTGDEGFTAQTENADYWCNPATFKNDDAKSVRSKIGGNGAGTIVRLDKHPYSLSKGEFISWASNSDKSEYYPTISYMGSNYSGNYGYYWTTDVIWEHLFKQFTVKEAKPESEKQESSDNSESSDGESSEALSNADIFSNGLAIAGGKNVAVVRDTVSGDSIEPDAVYYGPEDSIFGKDDFYFGDDYREGESRMIEVSGWLVKDGSRIKAEMNPMFSYEGDLSFADITEVKDTYAYTFAAIDKDGKIIKSPVDNEYSITEFDGNFIDTATTTYVDGKKVSGKERNEVSFNFDAEYPKQTAEFVIIKGKISEKDLATWTKSEKAGSVIWSSADEHWDTGYEVEGELLDSDVSEEEIFMEWDAYQIDAKTGKDVEKQPEFYTEVYYCPEGDEGEVFFIADEEDLNGENAISIDPSEYGYTDDAYIWVKVTDGINSCDIFSDENDVSVSNATVTLTGLTKTRVDGELRYSKEYTGSEIVPGVSVKVVDPETGKSIALVKDTDYKVTLKDNVKVGTASVVIEGIGAYPGRKVVNFTIKAKSFAKAKPQDIPDVVYSANVDNVVRKALLVYDNLGNELSYDLDTRKSDYAVTYGTGYDTSKKKVVSGNSTLADLYKVAVQTGKDEEGKTYKYFEGKKGAELDYLTVTAVFTGKGQYAGECTKRVTFKMYLEDAKVKTLQNATAELKKTEMNFTGKALKPAVKSVVMNGETAKLKTKYYKVVYSNNVNLGKGKVTIVGKNGYVGSITKTFDIIPKEVTGLTVKGIKNLAYTGSAVSANSLPITVKAGNVVLRNGIDYEVKLTSYGKNDSSIYTDVTTKAMKNAKTIPAVEITLKNKDTVVGNKTYKPVVTWKKTVADSKKTIKKTFNIVQASLANTAATTVMLKNPKGVNTLTVSGNDVVSTYNVTVNTDRKTAKKFAYTVSGNAAKLTFNSRKDTLDLANALVIKSYGKVLDKDYYTVTITTTRSGKYGKITVKAKNKVTKDAEGRNVVSSIYKGSRVIKFKYIDASENKDE